MYIYELSWPDVGSAFDQNILKNIGDWDTEIIKNVQTLLQNRRSHREKEVTHTDFDSPILLF